MLEIFHNTGQQLLSSNQSMTGWCKMTNSRQSQDRKGRWSCTAAYLQAMLSNADMHRAAEPADEHSYKAELLLLLMVTCMLWRLSPCWVQVVQRVQQEAQQHHNHHVACSTQHAQATVAARLRVLGLLEPTPKP